MQIFYSNVKKGEQSVTPTKRREMRNAITDYGALQPSPVHENPEIPDSDGPPGYGSPDKHRWPVNDTTKGIQTGSIAAVSIPSTSASFVLEDDPGDVFTMDLDILNTEFNIDVDLEAAQGFWQAFWANFPGEVEAF
jgi:hypothetical protein